MSDGVIDLGALATPQPVQPAVRRIVCPHLAEEEATGVVQLGLRPIFDLGLSPVLRLQMCRGCSEGVRGALNTWADALIETEAEA